MLSTAARIAQSLEAALYVAAGALLVLGRQWSVPAAILAALAFALGIRFALVCLSFTLGWVHRSPRAPEHRIGMLATACMLLREWRALIAFNLAYLPWERAFLRPDPAPRRDGPAPILLVHGYFANRGYFVPLVRRLERAGAGAVHVPNLRSWLAPIGRFERELGAELDRIARASGRPVVLIAHSMGGLGARACLARQGAANVSRLITIASPHHGTALGSWGLGENAREMCPGAAFLAALERAEGAGPGIAALSLYSAHDNLVAPQETSRLPWARNVALAGLGHLEITASDAAFEVLAAELREAGALPPDSGH